MQVVKIAILTLALVYSAQSAPSDEFDAKVKSAKEKCKTSDPAKDEETFAKVWGFQSLPSTESESCYVACLMKDIGAYADGKFSKEVLNTLSENRWTEPELLKKAKENDDFCIREVKTEGKDDCTAVQDLLKCFFNTFKPEAERR